MGDLSDIERLRTVCEEVEDREDWDEWHEYILNLLQSVREYTREGRESEEFHQFIWNENPISHLHLGEINVDQAILDKELRSWLAEESLRELPDDPQKRLVVLEKIHDDLLECVISIVKGPRPLAKTTRLLAALFPEDFTTLVAEGVLDEFISKFNDSFPTMQIEPPGGSVPSKHRQILDKLDKALGPVPEGDLKGLVRRMTLPIGLLNKLTEQGESTEPEAVDDSDKRPLQDPEGTAVPQNHVSGDILERDSVPQNIILYGPPGTGKTYATFRRCVEICDGKENAADMSDKNEYVRRYRELVTKKRVEFVTFHQSYGYEEFVEGLRPVLNEVQGNDVAYELHDGVFKRIALRAAAEGLPKPAGETDFDDTVRRVQKVLDQSDSDGASFSFSDKAPQYVLIIDEINRGNVSKILGELITLLEPDKRLGSANELTLPLSYSPSHRFGVPPNLHILGTMNTADRSIALIDTALRRRFDFEELPPDPDLLDDVEGIDLGEVLRAINKRLEYLVDRDHLVGYAWLMGAGTKADVDRIMRRKIIPLIAEYFYDDWEKVRAVLGGTNGFVKRESLSSPPGINATSEDRYHWTVQEKFEKEVYDCLISGSGQIGME